ncbi:DUF1540 domain-containing protein [Halothermothrix orenii]|uniref:DUF1540 domain-containing protein n=1 Tax=Halothermothrix orenii TaxID=31909 RepID=UPI000320046B|nr:DUF1540 domain-containing protein [Halothermothrix orenii]
MTDVKCSVDNCRYNNDLECEADTIQVAKNFLGENDMEVGMMGKDSSDSAQTKCVTFKPGNK